MKISDRFLTDVVSWVVVILVDHSFNVCGTFIGGRTSVGQMLCILVVDDDDDWF